MRIMTLVDITTITLDAKTKSLLDEYAHKHSISRSATIRLLVNEYFLKQENPI